jgi:HSP20 family protein
MSSKRIVYFQTGTEGVLPLMDLYEMEDSLIFDIDLPGVNPDDVLIKVYGDIVIIEGIKRESKEERRLRYICMERSFESFRRIIKIPVPVDTTAGRAWYREGVLTLRFPKVPDRVIKIKIEK